MSVATLSDQLCACGCGEFTLLATYNKPCRGYILGEPLTFLKGHNRKRGIARPIIDGWRQCLRCGESKPVEYFQKRADSPSGYGAVCCQCVTERGSLRNFVAALSKKYGLTHEQWLDMMEAQGGRCKVCGSPPSEGRSLHVDHCHATGVVRGLLCFGCNAAMGAVGDSPETLRALADYLEKAASKTAFHRVHSESAQ